MAYYADYIRERAEQTFNYDDARFALYDQDHEEMEAGLDVDLNREMFVGAMREMVAYLYERRREMDNEHTFESLFDPENVETIYITARGLEAPTVIVEYEQTPAWFEMENADLREFYWHPKPALSGEWTAGYFQPR